MPIISPTAISPHRIGGKSWRAYWATHLFGEDDLKFRTTSRSGLTMPDDVGSDDANILLPYFYPKVNGEDTDYRHYIFTGITAAANTIVVFRGALRSISASSPGDGCNTFYLGTVDWGGRKYRFIWGDSSEYTIGKNISAVAADTNWHTFIMYDKRLWILSPTTELTDISILNVIATITPDCNHSTGTWVSPSAEFSWGSHYALNAGSLFGGSHLFMGTITDSVITWQKKYILNNGRVWADILNGEAGLFLKYDKSAPFGGYTRFSSNGYSDALAGGYSCYKLDGSPDINIPLVNGTAISTVAVPAGYVKYFDVEGNETLHNFYGSLIEFVGAEFDRSDTDIYEDAARAGYYDAANPKRWHVSEFNRLQLNTWLKESYRGIWFPKINPNSVDIEARNRVVEIFSYNTNKTGDDFNYVLRYTGDYNLIVI